MQQRLLRKLGMKNLLFLLIMPLLLLSACQKERADSPINNEDEYSGWAVPITDVVISENAKDRIQAIDSTHHIIASATELKSSDLVFLYSTDHEVIAYPLSILGAHEIVNDQFENHYFSISYCPLTGSGIAFSRQLTEGISSFGVSGHLYMENLVPYDRSTGSYWSQMKLQGVRGRYSGENLNALQLIMTTYGTAQKASTDLLVLSDSSGTHICDSICSPRVINGQLLFSNSDASSRTLADENGIFGVVQKDAALLFDYNLFKDSIHVYKRSYRGAAITVVGSHSLQFITAFKGHINGTGSVFKPIQNAFPLVMHDELGNSFDVFGKVTAGPAKGNRLEPADAYFAYAFAWASFFPDHEYFKDN